MASTDITRCHVVSIGLAGTLTMSSAVSTRRIVSQKMMMAPSVSDLIMKAATASTERGAVSLVALKNALRAGGYDVEKNRSRVVIAVKRLVAKKSLVQVKGSGASGSFKVNEKPPAPRKQKVVKTKAKVKRVKRTGVKRATRTAAVVSKKSAKKKKPKSSKKAKKATKAPKVLRRIVTRSMRRAATK